jgi:hypothetical protein
VCVGTAVKQAITNRIAISNGIMNKGHTLTDNNPKLGLKERFLIQASASLSGYVKTNLLLAGWREEMFLVYRQRLLKSHDREQRMVRFSPSTYQGFYNLWEQ